MNQSRRNARAGALLAAITLLAPLPAYAACTVGTLTDTSGLAASSIHGGTTGAFVREMTCPGYQGIVGYLTPPAYATSSDDEQPWIYYGLSDGSVDVEAGLSFQKGDGETKFPRWRPYLRQGSSFYYADDALSVQPGVRAWIKAVYKSGRVLFYLDGAEILSLAVTMSPEAIRVRRVTGIATPYTFDGTNISSSGLIDVLWESTQITADSGATYTRFDDVPLSAWQSGGLWYGSVYWPSGEVRYTEAGELDTLSIFRDTGSGGDTGGDDGDDAGGCEGRATPRVHLPQTGLLLVGSIGWLWRRAGARSRRVQRPGMAQQR